MVARRMPSRASRHVDEPVLERDAIRSGEQLAPIVHRGAHASIGEGGDGSLWILVHDPERRPRGRDPGNVVEALDVRYEINGLVRVPDRRLARGTLERLVGSLTGHGTRIEGSLTRRSRIPAGSYAGVVVEPIDAHYRVRASGATAKRFADMQPLGKDRWLVIASEESTLRRILVNELMPVHHRALWAATRHGERLLAGVGIGAAALSFAVPLAAPLAVFAAVGLGAFRWRRAAIVRRVRRRLVQPHIDRTTDSRDAPAANAPADAAGDESPLAAG